MWVARWKEARTASGFPLNMWVFDTRLFALERTIPTSLALKHPPPKDDIDPHDRSGHKPRQIPG